MTGTAKTFAYIGNAGSNDISVFRFDTASGAMSPLQTADFVGVDKAGGSTPLAVSPDRRVLIAGVRSQPYLAVSFAIDARTGELTHIGNGPLADSMAYLAFDRTGQFLFSASYGGHKVAVNPLQPGGVAGAPSQVIPTGLNAHAILPSPDNRFAFATNIGSEQVLAFAFDAGTGVLSANEAATVKTPEQSGPRHFIFHPNGKFTYVLHDLNADVGVYAYDADHGTWHEQQRITALPQDADGKPFAGKIAAADLHLTPDGRFLYTSERSSSTLTSFKVDAATGQLTRIESVPTETQPRGFNIDPTGHFLAAVGELSNSMTISAIDQATGRLTKLASHAVGKQPNWVEFVSFP